MEHPGHRRAGQTATTTPAWSTRPLHGEIQHTARLSHTQSPGIEQCGVCRNARQRGLGARTEVRYCVRVAQRLTPGR